jgi:putative alpha-1,2-mannosidase
MSALGFYTVDPSSPNYILGSPVFSRATINLTGGRTSLLLPRIIRLGTFIFQSAKLNGAVWNKPWISYSDIANGGRLELVMGSVPNKSWGSSPEAAPPSMSASSK